MTHVNNLHPGGQAALTEKLKHLPSLKMGNAELRFEPSDLDPIYIETAEKELRETPDNVAEGLEGLRELLKSEPDLIVPAYADEYLYRFLRPCKWYPKSTFELMKRFYEFRRSYPKICKDLLPTNEKSVLSSGVIIPLPRRCRDGARILIIEAGKKWNPKEISLEEMFKGAMLTLDAAMAEPTTQVCGVRVIMDMAGLSLSQVTYFTPSFARAVLEWVQRCFPARLKGVHVVNQSFIFNMVFAIFKPFVQEKLRRRIHFHGTDRVGLKEHIGSRTLPTRYGGDLEIPDEPIGLPLWEYYCTFEEDFKGEYTDHSDADRCSLKPQTA